MLVVLFHIGQFAPAGSTLAKATFHMDIGVAIFFTLTGFLLYRPFVAAALGLAPGVGVRDFFIRRLLRVVPGFWVATAIFGALGIITLSGPAGVFNFSFLQIYLPSYVTGGIPPGWSVCVELSFYLILPFAVRALGQASSLKALVVRHASIIGALALLSLAIRPLVESVAPNRYTLVLLPLTFPWFAVGMLIALLDIAITQRLVSLRTVQPKRLVLVAVGLYALLVLFFEEGGVTGSAGIFVLYGLLAGLLLLAAVQLRDPPALTRAWRLASWIGLISYGIYLYHFPIIRYVSEHSDTGGLVEAVLLIASGIVGAVVLGALSFYLVERPALRYKPTGRGQPAAASGKPSGKSSIGRSIAWNGVGQAVALFIALGLAPFMVARLGLAEFGFWALIAALSQYTAVVDFGVGAALMKFIAEHDSLDQPQQLAAKVAAGTRVGFAVSFALSLIATAVVVAMPEAWSDSWPDDWSVAVLLCTATLICAMWSSQSLAFARALGRWELQSLAVIANQVVFASLAVVGLLIHPGLLVLGLASLAGGLAMLTVAVMAKRRLWTKRTRVAPTRAEVRSVLTYGMNLQAGAIATVVNLQADKPLILLAGGSLEFVGLYELASRVAFQLRSLPVLMLGPITAQVARDVAGKSKGFITERYNDVYPRLVEVGVAGLVALYGLSFGLVLAWLGPDFETTAWIMLALGLGYAFNMVTGAGSSVANASGRPDLERRYTVVCLAVNVTASIVLGAIAGPWGVIAATCLGLIVSAIYFLFQVDRWLDLPQLSSFRALRGCARPLIWSFAIAGGALASTVFGGAESRIALLLIAAGWGTVGLLGFLILVPDTRRPLSRAPRVASWLDAAGRKLSGTV